MQLRSASRAAATIEPTVHSVDCDIEIAVAMSVWDRAVKDAADILRSVRQSRSARVAGRKSTDPTNSCSIKSSKTSSGFWRMENSHPTGRTCEDRRIFSFCASIE